MADPEDPQALQRQGEERDTRFDASADGGGGADDAPPQLPELDNEFDELTGDPNLYLSQGLPQLPDWLAARGVSKESQESLRDVDGGVFLPTTAWNREDFVAYLPAQVGELGALEDDAGIEQKAKPPARLENWYRLQERLLRDHFWEMKTKSGANKWDREVAFLGFLKEAGSNHLNAGGLEPKWLDADRRYLNVLPDAVRREGWLRNPPRKGGTASDVDQWPGGLIRRRRQHTGLPMSTALSKEGVSTASWWGPIFFAPKPLGGSHSTGEALLRLDVEVLSLTFRDHSNYTEEDRVARLLSDLYKAYTIKITEGKIDHLKHKIDAIKVALGEAAPDGETAKNYRKELREVREMVDQEHGEQKQRERQLREVWNKLKYLRKEVQKFNGAAIKMAWRSKKVDAAAEQAALDTEMDERVGELRAEYDARLGEFDSRIEKLEALKVDKEEKRTAAATGHDPAKEARYASAIKKLDSRLNQLRRSTPAVKGFDDEEQRSKLMERYEALHTRMPGEPWLVPVMMQDPIDDLKDTNEEERLRRARVKATSFHVKLELDGQELKHRSPSMAMPSTAESSIDFAHRFPIAVAAPPESVYLHVYETTDSLTAGKTHIAKVPIQIPGGGSLLPQKISQHSNVAFSGGEPFETYTTRMDANNKASREPAIHYVDGDLSVRVTWDTTAANSLINANAAAGESALKSLLPAGPVMDPNDPTGGITASHMPGIAGGHGFDPNNPLDLPVIGGLREVVMEEGTALDDPTDRNTFFRLDKDDNDVNLVQPNVAEEKRNTLLQLRDSGKSDPALRDMPFKAEDVSPDMMEGATDEDILDFKKGKKKKVLTAGELKKLELKKRAGTAMPSVRTREVTTEECVREEELPAFKLSFDWLFELLAPRNPLRPKLQDRKAQRGITEATIVVQVVSASNVPCRHDPSQPMPGPEEDGVCVPFIEVQFGRHEEGTRTQQGTNVQWNDVIELPYASTSGDLNAEKGEVKFNLFDRVIVRDDANKNVVSERHEKRWLASFNLPFQTIFRNKSINGTVPMSLPLMNLGYRIPEPQQAVNLSFYATLEPNILPPEMEEDERASAEDEVLTVFAKKWMQDIEKRDICKDRNIAVLAPSSSGESVFVTRYIWPQKPPPQCDNEETVARFVALLPFANDEDEDSGETVDIWYTTHEFLQTQAGDWEEHAILLCNYFLYQKKDAYVCLGTAMPDGDAAFVLTKENRTWYVWNPTTGKKFLQTDHDCPLKELGMVFNKDNVWANIQGVSSNICYDSLDFDDVKCWRPFFDENYSAGDLATCQKDDVGNTDITYYNPNMKTVWDDSKESADERKKFIQSMEKDVKGSKYKAIPTAT